MSAITGLLRLPRYARNLRRLREIAGVLVGHGFGHLSERSGIARLARFGPGRRLLGEPDEQIALLTWEERIRLMCESLGPTFVKLGQMAATRPDLVPMSLVLELRKLQDDVPAVPFDLVRAVIEAELGQSLAEAFEYFDETPIAAASIAQVHRARLPGGAEVAVKVQRPGLDERIRTDLELLQLIAEQVEANAPETRQFRPAAAVEEFARSLRRETDFANELRNIERFRKLVAGNPLVHVLATYPAFSTRRVLTMELIKGAKVTDKAKLTEWQVDNRQIADAGVALVIESIFEHGFFHADPHPGNFFVLPDGRLALIDFGMMGSLDRDRIDDLLGFLVAILLGDTEMMVTQFVDLGLIDDTVDVRGLRNEIHEILQSYGDLNLAQLDIAVFIQDVFESVVRYNVQMPADLLLIGKSISTMEGIAQELHPDFNPLESIRPYLVRLYVRRVLDPVTYSRRIYRILHDYFGLFKTLPGEIRGVLRRLKLGELQLNLHDVDAERQAMQRERLVNRALMAGMSLVSWTLFTVTLPDASRVDWTEPAAIWASLLALNGVVTGALLLWSLARSREL